MLDQPGGKTYDSFIRRKEGPHGGGTGMGEKEEGCGRGQQRPRREAGMSLGLRLWLGKTVGLGFSGALRDTQLEEAEFPN